MSDSPDRRAILDAAARVFAEKGFSGARIDEIAAEAGVNKAMLYYRVGDKEELYRQVVLLGQSTFRDALLDALDSNSDVQDTLRAVVDEITRRAMENRLLPSIILREMAGGGATLPREGLEGIRNLIELIRSIISSGVESGSIREINSVVLQFLIIGTVFTLALTTEMRLSLSPDYPGPLKPIEISSSLVDIIFRGILPQENNANDVRETENQDCSGVSP